MQPSTTESPRAMSPWTTPQISRTPIVGLSEHSSQWSFGLRTGRVVWDMDGWKFLDEACRPTANPSLWRQCQLTARHGLYKVTERIYQVRGFDLSNMTLIEGDTGVVGDRPASVSGDRGRGHRALSATSRRPTGHRRDLHPRARGSLRRR